MKIYIIYDKRTGQILHKHRLVMLDKATRLDTMPCGEAEVLSTFRGKAVPREFLGVALVDYRPRSSHGRETRYDATKGELIHELRPLAEVTSAVPGRQSKLSRERKVNGKRVCPAPVRDGRRGRFRFRDHRFGPKPPLSCLGSVTMVYSRADFDRDNAYALDIFEVDGIRTTARIFGGDHWGPEGDVENVFEGALVGNGRLVRFDLRGKRPQDLDAFGVAIVVTLD